MKTMPIRPFRPPRAGTVAVHRQDFQRRGVRAYGGYLREIGLELRLRGAWRKGGGRLGDAVDEQFRRTEAARVAVGEGDVRHDLQRGWAVDGRALRIEDGLPTANGAGSPVPHRHRG